ncbi:hypothetical protein ACOTJD_30580 [Achromobacter xylosoxidans]
MDAEILISAQKVDLSENELRAAVAHLLKLRSIKESEANHAELAAEIVRHRQVEFSIRATLEPY